MFGLFCTPLREAGSRCRRQNMDDALLAGASPVIRRGGSRRRGDDVVPAQEPSPHDAQQMPQMPASIAAPTSYRQQELEEEEAARVAVASLEAPGHRLIHLRPPSAISLLHYTSTATRSPKRTRQRASAQRGEHGLVGSAPAAAAPHTRESEPATTAAERTLRRLRAADVGGDTVTLQDAAVRRMHRNGWVHQQMLAEPPQAARVGGGCSRPQSSPPWATELGLGPQPPAYRAALVLDDDDR
jgi:hypothetical protein